MSSSNNVARSLYIVDETSIENRNDEVVDSEEDLQKHVKMINLSLDFIDRILRAQDHRTADELVVHRLAVRCFNSGAASLRLARMGYYSQCLSLIRDIMETALLLDLFGREPPAVEEWCATAEKDRHKRFSPIKVRFRLEEIERQEGKAALNRAETYQRFCTYGTHVSPEGFVLISPDNQTQIGPFPDAGRFRAMVEEIVQHLTFATIVFADHVPEGNENVMQIKNVFYDLADVWADEFIRGRSKPE